MAEGDAGVMVNPRGLVGQKIEQFRIDEYIAKGAMGMVFKAFDTVLTRTVAIKLILREPEDHNMGPQEVAMREEARKRLIQEAKAAGQLSHPNIVTVYSYGETDEFEYICMEYVPGKTLAQALTERKAFDPLEAITIFQQVLQALDAANSQQIVHRDIKPSNIMITPDERVKVMDFGVAKLPALSMTVTGTVLGTPYYMSPEQIVGQKVDIRSDIFSVGTVFYETLTGERPFEAQDTAALTYQIINVEPVPPVARDTKIPPPVSEIVTRAMAKDRAQRYQTPVEMLQDLIIAKEIVRGARRAKEDQNVLARIIDSGQLRPAQARYVEDMTVEPEEPEKDIIKPEKKKPPKTINAPSQRGPKGLKIAAAAMIFVLVVGIAVAVLYRQWNRARPEATSPATDIGFPQGAVPPAATPETQSGTLPSTGITESIKPPGAAQYPTGSPPLAPEPPAPETIAPAKKAQTAKPSPKTAKPKEVKAVEKKPSKKKVEPPPEEPPPSQPTETEQDTSSPAEQATVTPPASSTESVTPPVVTQPPASTPMPPPPPEPPAEPEPERPKKPTSFSGAKTAYANREITAQEYREIVIELKTAYVKEVEQLKLDYRAGTIDKAEYYRRAVEIKTRYR